MHPWDEMVYIIQKFFTCEGRYSIVYLYHIKLLLHLKGQCTISLPYFLLQSLTKMSKTIQKKKGNEDKSLYNFWLIKILIEFEVQRRGKTWKEFLVANQIKDGEDEQEQQENSRFMFDIDEEIPVHKTSNIPPPSSSVRMRKMRQEATQKIEQDKIFTTYTRRSRRIQKIQTQEDKPESNAHAPMDIESSSHSQPRPKAEMEVESNNRQGKESPPTNKKQRRLEKQIEKLKEELMGANMLEKVIKKENEMLRAQSKETQQKNEKLKEQIKELEAEQIDICNWATKWYTQKKALKEKYKNLKHELHIQKDT